MSVYLIDYENIKSEGMNGIDELTKDDVVCLFYSENANTMTFRMHRKINDCRADFRFQDVGVGSKNALDFQLTSRQSSTISSARTKVIRVSAVSGATGATWCPWRRI